MVIRMPKLGMEMTEGVLSRWLVEDGATVEKGQPIYEIETEKVENEISATEAGQLRQTALAGETYAVGALLGRLDS
jgi:pyruvate/2-oxoglutarate dehydrogenase complex dihydrolipoamide acyltransferase (E2) component